MTLLETAALSLLVVLIYMTAVWLLGLAKRNASIVDVFWGLGFVLLAALYFIPTDGDAAALGGTGFLFEPAGDWQLARFKADPANKGRVMRSGLWRHTRHPNYF